MSGGDYLRYQHFYGDACADLLIIAADTGTKHPIADRANHTLYVQKVTVSVTTDAAQTLTLQDTSAAQLIGKTKASPGLGPILFDFGPKGVALVAGKGLDVAISAAGLACDVHIEAYWKLGVTNAPSTT